MCGSRFKLLYRVSDRRIRPTTGRAQGIREQLWAACSNERRVPLRRDVAGDSFDRPAAHASLRLAYFLREARRDVNSIMRSADGLHAPFKAKPIG
jgi:hypothetical protein